VDLPHEDPGEPLHLARAELRGVDLDPALGPAERHAHHRGLPGHEAGERAHLVDVDLGVVAQPALERPARVVVLHAVADEVADGAVVAAQRELDPQLAAGGHQDALHVLVDAEDLEGLLQEVLGGLVGVHGGRGSW
jgi:hypothetical protein